MESDHHLQSVHLSKDCRLDIFRHSKISGVDLPDFRGFLDFSSSYEKFLEFLVNLSGNIVDLG